MSAIRILIVEDEPLIAAEVEACLSQADYQVCGKAYDRATAKAMLRSQQPDVVILDINLEGGLEGIELAAQIHRDNHIPFLFLTSYASPDVLDAAKVTEPAGFIVKPFTEKGLLASLEVAIYNFAQRRKTSLPTLQRETINQRLLSPLTQREFDLLALLWEGYTNHQMAERLYVSINTVKTHLKNCYLKLEVNNRTAAIVKAQELMGQ
jgi:DNA-binding NarL/FixJ family response regulator